MIGGTDFEIQQVSSLTCVHTIAKLLPTRSATPSRDSNTSIAFCLTSSCCSAMATMRS